MSSEFLIPDMSCGHCVRTITEVVKALEPAADVRIDLANHRVSVTAPSLDSAAVQAAIVEAGYTPHLLQPG